MKKFTVKFYLREKTFNPKNRQYKLYCRITYGGKSAHFALAYSFKKREWDKQKELHKTDEGINEELAFIRNRLMQIKRELYYQRRQISPYRVRMIFEGKLNIEGAASNVLLTDYIESYLAHVQDSQEHSAGTLEHYQSKFRGIKQFLKDSGLQHTCLSEITEDTLQQLDNYLVNYRTRLYKPLTRSAINDFHSRLKSLLKKAYKEKLIKENPYTRWQIPKIKRKREIRYITESELEAIRAKNFSHLPRLDQVKDKFLFSCYTGLRFSDVEGLLASEIKKGEMGYHLEREQAKTKVTVYVPLLTPAVEIYKKYMALHYHEITGKLFPPLTNAALNTYLKELADLCGIEKNLTHHMARHTCGTMLLNYGVSLEVVKEILGHTSIHTTAIYAKIIKGTLWRDMSKVDRKMKGKGNDSE